MNAKQFWDDFTFDYVLDEPGLFADLVSIEGYKQAALNLVLPLEWSNQLDRLNRVRAVHGTTALEGNTFSEAEVDLQIGIAELEEEAANLRQRQPSKERLQILNADRAQEWVRNRFAPGTPPANVGDLLTMHRIITERSDEGHNVPGQFRAYPVQVGSQYMGGVHYGAPHDNLGELMESFIGFINDRRFASEHPVVKALLAHFFLVTIHPFGDGNGRVSRLLEAGILFQNEFNVHGFYGLSNYFYRNETEYKQLLQECRQRNPFNVSPFIKFGVRGFSEELAGINNFVKTKLNRLVYRQMIVQNYQRRLSPRRRVLNAREYNLLAFLLTATEPIDPFSDASSRQITLSELLESQYVKGAYSKVAPRTLRRELVRLATEGFIKFTRDAKNTTSTASVVELDFGAIAKYPVG